MLIRDLYISRIEPFYDSTFIKVLIGMRGAGKSTLFSQIINDLKDKELADDAHIIHINLEFLENDKVRDREKLENYIRKKLVSKQQYYIFLDEIQYIERFEELIAKFSDEFTNLSFFISSSNSRLFLGELNRNIIRNCKIFYITPFSYNETCKFLNTVPKNKNMLLNYLKYGGLPERLSLKKSSEVRKFFYYLVDSIFLRDIVMRLGILDIDNINDVFKCVIQFMGKDFSMSKLKDSLESIGKFIPEDKLYTDFDCLCKALTIYGAPIYNVHTNQVGISTPRYYMADLGLGFIFCFDVANNMDAILKNLVWLELKRRGYEIYTGLNGDYRFDFVAIRKDKIMYLHVVNLLEDGNTVNKEIEKLSNFDFNGKRYLLSLDTCNYSRKGVIHKNIIDFILEGEDDIEDLSVPDSWMAVE